MRLALIIAAFVFALAVAVGVAVFGAKLAVKGEQIVSAKNQTMRGELLRVLGIGLALLGILVTTAIFIVTISEAL